MVGQFLRKNEFEHRAAVFEIGRTPERARVPQEVEGSSIGVSERCHRLAAQCDALAQQRLVGFEITDALLTGGDDAVRGGWRWFHDFDPGLMRLANPALPRCGARSPPPTRVIVGIAALFG